jgi:fibronectin type 3 domain-containing protein
MRMERISFLLSRIGLILLFVSSVFLFPSLGQPAQVSLAWDTSQSSNIIGYKIYSGVSSGNYAQSTNVGLTNSYTLTNLIEGKTYYFAATALGSSGFESAYSNEINYTVPLSQTIYTINASAGANGTISPSGAVSLTQGITQTFTIQPNTNYRIAGVTVDGASVGAVSSYTFTNVIASHTINASFVQNSPAITITASAGANGTITPSGSITVTQGSNKTFTISPKRHYRIARVTVDGVSVGAVNSYTFSKVSASHVITAIFKRG